MTQVCADTALPFVNGDFRSVLTREIGAIRVRSLVRMLT
jgi:hypothetical protein